MKTEHKANKDLEYLIASNNFVYRLKKLIESFNEVVNINKSRKEDLNEISKSLDNGFKFLELPAKAYHKDGLFHIDICEKEQYN